MVNNVMKKYLIFNAFLNLIHTDVSSNILQSVAHTSSLTFLINKT